jgi:hypothetical protein
MSLRAPPLDDRRFDDLLAEAKRVIERSCPGWTDLSPGDPGMVLVEVFAHLTEVMIYRLNRLPDRAYVEFLRLIGVQLAPPGAAAARLRFTCARPADAPVAIAKGTRVAAGRASPGKDSPVFTTAETVVIPKGAAEVEVDAYHCDLVQGELIGKGTGSPGLSLRVARPPIVAPTADGQDLVVAVETGVEEKPAPARGLHHEGHAFRVWREVPSFASVGPDPYVYVVDRVAGTITFAPALRAVGEGGLADAPAALGAVPPAGREVRAWYRRGGGASGNVTANTLTALKDPLPGVSVTNPAPAAGGRDAETLENALARGPQDLHSLRRAVTARDFELIASQGSGAIDRAHAFTRATLWAHARPGAVEVLLVPRLPAERHGDGPVTLEQLIQAQSEAVPAQIQRTLERRKPLGTTCVVSWARYKPVRVGARVVVYREEEPAAVAERVLRRLNQTVSPLAGSRPGTAWGFGQALTAWHVYRLLGTEPGVRSVSDVRLLVDESPDTDVRALAADAYQAHTWYAGTGERIFRSLNDGEGWELVGQFEGEEIGVVRPFPREAASRTGRAGLLAVATRPAGADGGSRLHFSRDCGESWETGPRTEFRIEDIAWVERDGTPALLLAAEVGLYELAWSEKAVPVQVLVDPGDPNLGFYAVAVSTDVWGETSVAVAGRGERGVFLSSQGGKPSTFKHVGLAKELVRVLAVQHAGPHRYLWAGIAAPGETPGKGALRWRLTGSAENPEGWRAYDRGWAVDKDAAGGCNGLAFLGSTVLAASSRRGVLSLDPDARDAAWKAPALDCGLPLRDVKRLLQPVDAVATDPDGRVALVAGGEGVYRRHSAKAGEERYQASSVRAYADRVTLPTTWLFCSGNHEITVVGEDESERD